MRYLTLSILLITSFTAIGCTCLPKLNVKKSFRHSEVIFSAKVIEIAKPKPQPIKLKDGTETFVTEIFGNTVKLELLSIYKGKLKSKIITISPDKTNCEFQFIEGRKYVIFGWHNGSEISTDVCSRTALLENNKDLEFLSKKLKKLRTKKTLNQN